MHLKMFVKSEILFFILLCVQYSSQRAQTVCWIEGLCNGKIVDQLENVPSKEKCLKECKINENCNW